MKPQFLRLTAAIALFAGACLAPLSAATITLTVDDLLGTIYPGTPANEANATAQVKFLVDAYNFPKAHGTVLGDNSADGQNEVYTLYRPTDAPGTLAAPVSFGKVNTSNPVVDLGGFNYEYILYFQASNAWVYYIGDIGGSNSINWGGNPLTNPDASNENGSKISHYVLFNGRPDVVIDPHNNVPDGGTTILLVGAGLLLTAVAARRKKSA